MFRMTGLRNQGAGLSKATALLLRLTLVGAIAQIPLESVHFSRPCGHHLSLIRLPFFLLDKWSSPLIGLMVSGHTFLKPESFC